MKNLLVICAICLLVLTSVVVQQRCTEVRYALAVQSTPPTGFEEVIAQESLSSAVDDALLVTIDAADKMRIDGRDAGDISDAAALHTRFEQALREDRRKRRALLLRVPRSLKYDRVERVIKAAKSAGAFPIHLEVKDTEEEP